MFQKAQYGIMILGLCVPLAHAQLCTSKLGEKTATGRCDASFINPPIFGNLCQNGVEFGIYTLRNNTPVSLTINYIRIQDNDSLPGAATAIVPSVTNNCGSSVAPGATCNITVELLPLSPGIFNRVLQVGINTRQVELSSPVINAAVGNCVVPGPLPPAGFIPTIAGTPLLPLFQAAILASSTVTNTGPTLVSGDLDLTPGSSVTGFPPGTVVNGAININNAAAFITKTQAQTYFTALNALTCSPGDTYGAGTDISALPQPIDCTGNRVLCFTSTAFVNSSFQVTGTPGSSCTFKINSSLTVANNAIMTKAGGILNDNINWAVGSSATLGTNSTLIGIIDALASITLNTGAVLNGRAWALNGAVTLDSNQIIPN